MKKHNSTLAVKEKSKEHRATEDQPDRQYLHNLPMRFLTILEIEFHYFSNCVPNSSYNVKIPAQLHDMANLVGEEGSHHQLLDLAFEYF